MYITPLILGSPCRNLHVFLGKSSVGWPKWSCEETAGSSCVHMCWDVKPLPVAVKKPKKYDYLVDSTHLKNNISQIGNLPQVGVKIRNL